MYICIKEALLVTLHRERNAVLVRMGCDICALEKLVAIDVNHLAVYSDCATSSYCNTLYMRSTMTLERLPHDSSGAQNLAGVSQAQYHESPQRMMAMKGSAVSACTRGRMRRPKRILWGRNRGLMSKWRDRDDVPGPCETRFIADSEAH